MKTFHKLLRGGGVLMGGQMLGQVLSLVRNVIVARLLEPADFGIAATFALAMSMFDLISNLSVDRLLVQAEDGDHPAFQDTAQSFLVARGAICALALFALATIITEIFQIPEARWAFECLALVPLIRGFAHLDTKRRHREYIFSADVASELVPQVVLLAFAWPLAYWLEDYSAMLWLIILQAVLSTALTHLFCKRRYRLGWNRAFARRISKFGWPLMLNGAVMFLVAQGDRIIVGGKFSMAELGAYSVATMLVVAAGTAFAKMGGNLFLPLFSEAGADKEKFAYIYQAVSSVYFFFSLVLSVGAILLGAQCVELLYGSKYSMAGSVIGWIAIAQAFNLMKAMSIVAAFAKADSKIALYCNTTGSLGTVLALVAAIQGYSIVYVPIGMLCGNILAFGVATTQLSRTHDLPARLLVVPVGIFSIAVVSASALHQILPQSIGVNVFVSIVLVLAVSAGFLGIKAVRDMAMRLTGNVTNWRLLKG